MLEVNLYKVEIRNMGKMKIVLIYWRRNLCLMNFFVVMLKLLMKINIFVGWKILVFKEYLRRVFVY